MCSSPETSREVIKLTVKRISVVPCEVVDEQDVTKVLSDRSWAGLPRVMSSLWNWIRRVSIEKECEVDTERCARKSIISPWHPTR